jgi:hydroxymethylpyrimidine kinase/phosphomethylpyrimidine kinase
MKRPLDSGLPMKDTRDSSSFRPLTVGALYTGIERSLAADVLAANALGGQALTVCTTHLVASHGQVTDVLPVPADTVDAQLEHLFATTTPTGVKLGIMGGLHAIEAIFRRLESADAAHPAVLDLTLSGPSGEDLIEQTGIEAIVHRLGLPDVVTIRRRDAELLTQMEISSMDDAQVAVQRLQRQGAQRVLLRCGTLPQRFFDSETNNGDPAAAFNMDLYYDGDDFGLFEAPHLDVGPYHGASSALTLALLSYLVEGASVLEAVQRAKGFVSETLRHSLGTDRPGLHYHWQQETASPSKGD